MSDLKRSAVKACEKAFKLIGYKKTKGVLVGELCSGAQGWIGLNLAIQGLPHSMSINPVIGVRYVALDEKLHELRDDLPPGPLPVISRSLGYLTEAATFRTWDFTPSTDVEQQAASLLEVFRQSGEPFIEKYSDWGFIVAELRRPGSHLLKEHERAKILPVVVAMDGDISGARDIVAAEMDRVAGKDDMYAISYREFAEVFFSAYALLAIALSSGFDILVRLQLPSGQGCRNLLPTHRLFQGQSVVGWGDC